MPNHVHAIVQPLRGYELEQIMHSWKSFTSHEIQKLRGTSGQIWRRSPTITSFATSHPTTVRSNTFWITRAMPALKIGSGWVQGQIGSLMDRFLANSSRNRRDAEATLGKKNVGTLKGEQSTFPRGFHQDRTLLHELPRRALWSLGLVEFSICRYRTFAVIDSCGSRSNIRETPNWLERLRLFLSVSGSKARQRALSGAVGIIRA